MKKNIPFLLLVIIISVSCGGGGKPGVFIDGKKLELPHAIAIKNTKIQGYTMYLFNINKTQCENIQANMRQIPKGEIAVRLFTTTKNTRSIAGIGSHNQMMVDIELEKKPENPGDTIIMNVPSLIKMKPRIGKFKGKTVTIYGKFEAKYCGLRE